MSDLLKLTEVYFPTPGPREPGSTQYRRHYTDQEFLLLLDSSAKLIHIRKKTGPETYAGAVRTVDQTHAEFTLASVPNGVHAMSTPSKKP